MNDSKTERRFFKQGEKKIILAKTRGKCAHCGRKLDTETMTIDHVFPLDKGGLHDEYNMLALCEDCNVNKSNYVYRLRDYYNHIDDDEYEKFRAYSNYVVFDYIRQNIIGYDEVLFKFLPVGHYGIINQMKQRHAKKEKIFDMYNKLRVSIILRKAHPAAADEIFKMMQKNYNSERKLHDLYKSPYDILHDINTGCVYTLESGGSLCGVFIFRSVDTIKEDICVSQLANVIDEVGLELKYIMTYAMTTAYAAPALDEIMRYFETAQLHNGWMPVFYGIIDKMYLEKKECIIIPYQINGTQSTLEFMPVKHIFARRRETAKFVFSENGYDNVSEDDLMLFVDLTLRYTYLKDAKEAKGGAELFKKYPGLSGYFKPEIFDLYDAGMPAAT